MATMLAQTAVRSLLSRTHPLQFGGGFIELAIFFLLLALVAGVLGARGVAGLSLRIAKWLVILFIVLAVVSLLL